MVVDNILAAIASLIVVNKDMLPLNDVSSHYRVGSRMGKNILMCRFYRFYRNTFAFYH